MERQSSFGSTSSAGSAFTSRSATTKYGSATAALQLLPAAATSSGSRAAGIATSTVQQPPAAHALKNFGHFCMGVKQLNCSSSAGSRMMWCMLNVQVGE
jgi:hypothetical protein